MQIWTNYNFLQDPYF